MTQTYMEVLEKMYQKSVKPLEIPLSEFAAHSREIDRYIPFEKIPRLSRVCTVTEKIDGTNAAVRVYEDGSVRAGSRTRWITPEDDNFGFAGWVQDNAEGLRKLGVGLHRGEWWGKGIQRSYGLDHRRFSLFNTSAWNAENKPKCCCVVPVLYEGEFTTEMIEARLYDLRYRGSWAAPNFMKPEGVVVYHHAAAIYFKKTLEKDEEPKGK